MSIRRPDKSAPLQKPLQPLSQPSSPSTWMIRDSQGFPGSQGFSKSGTISTLLRNVLASPTAKKMEAFSYTWPSMPATPCNDPHNTGMKLYLEAWTKLSTVFHGVSCHRSFFSGRPRLDRVLSLQGEPSQRRASKACKFSSRFEKCASYQN